MLAGCLKNLKHNGEMNTAQTSDNESGGDPHWSELRTVAPAETLARLLPLISQMGITRIANVTGLDWIGIPVVMVTRPAARSLAVSQGKGLTLEAAKVSGVMEAVELFHAETIENPLKLGSTRELEANHALIDVSRLARVAGSRFHQDLVMLWIEGAELSGGESRWVPFECVRANFTIPPPPGSGCFDCSSNGLASGNTMAEAVCQGLCEVIERDSTALWNQSPRDERLRRQVDPVSIQDPACRTVLDLYANANLATAMWETTTDIGVPSYFCLVVDQDNPAGHSGVGAGAHPDPCQALLRALLEAAQVRMTYIAGARDDLDPAEYTDGWLRQRRTFFQRMLKGSANAGKFKTVDRAWTTETCVDFILDQLRSAGLGEPVIVDLSKPEFDIPVVRVVVPGLEGPDDHEGYVPGARAGNRK